MTTGRAVDGRPARQMQVLRASGDGEADVRARFTLRCADRAGAAGLIEAFDRVAGIAAARLGPDRALVVSGAEADAAADMVADRLLRLLHGTP